MPRRKTGVTPRRNADGTTSYEIRWRQGGTRDGRNLSHTFRREAAAAEAYATIVAAGYVCRCPKHVPDGVAPVPLLGAPVPPIPSPAAAETSFGALAARHVEAMTGVGPGYREQFRRELERHFGPFLARPMIGPAAITRLDVAEWIRGCETGAHEWLLRPERGSGGELVPSPLSATTVRRLLVQAGSVVAAAQMLGLAGPRNPFRGHRLGRRDRDQHTEMTTLTPEEFALLAECLPAGLYRDLATVLVGTGLRWGEVTALAVGAVDPLASPPRLHVARAWQSDGSNGYQLGTPKSKRSRRTVTFSAAVLDAVIPHLAGKRDDELVFVTEHRGAALRHSNFYHRVWLPALDRANAAGLDKRPRIHDLRHTHVSWLIAAGQPAAAISRRLGHESITTTIDRYGHMMPQLDVDAIAALDAALPARAE